MENCERLTKISASALTIGTFVIFALAIWLRSAGLLHGLDSGQTFHPDATKQVQAVQNFMDGKLLWYTDSLAYDGYPYGLNHVDAVLLRGIWPVYRGFAETLNPALHLPALPDRNSLFVLCRMLRVFYGMFALAAFAWALRHRGVSPPLRLLFLLAAATSPLLSTVTHSASGDVGTDLFVILALASLSLSRSSASARSFALCGFWIGCAFASKYHGLLAAATPGLLLLLQPWTWRTRFRLGFTCALGALAGFALLTPALFIRFGRTLKLIRENFTYIRRYGTDPEFFTLSPLQRLALCFRSNIPTVAEALGTALLLSAIVLLAVCLLRLARKRNPDLAWDTAVLAMPLLALTLAIAGKPQLQPFHFSFLPLPLLLGVAGASLHLRPRLRLLPALAVATLVLLQLRAQSRELFFWTREDTRQTLFRVSEELLQPVSEPRNLHDFGTLVFEPTNLAVFRNGPRPIRLPDSQDWAAAPHEALPAIPHDLGHDWLILSLPSFARDTRLLHLRDRQPWQRHLIDNTRVAEIPVHLQAGERSAHVTALLNGETFSIRLLPGETRVLPLDATRGISFSRGPHPGRLHAVRLAVRGGDVLARFGNPPPPGDPERVLRKLARSRFLEGTLRIAHRQNGAVLLETQHLPPARYRLRLQWFSSLPSPRLVIENADLALATPPRIIATQAHDGFVSAEWEQSGDALFSRLRIESVPLNASSLAWTIVPVSGVNPPVPFPTNEPPLYHPAIEYDNGDLSLGSIQAPGTLAAGENLVMNLRASLHPERTKLLHERVVLVHLLDAGGKQVFARDIRLQDIASPESPRSFPHSLGVPGLPPGSYQLTLGVYNPRIRVRLQPRIREGTPAPENRVHIGTLEIK